MFELNLAGDGENITDIKLVASLDLCLRRKLEGLSAALTELGRGRKQGNTLQNVCRQSWLLGIDTKLIWFECNRELIGFYNQG